MISWSPYLQYFVIVFYFFFLLFLYVIFLVRFTYTSLSYSIFPGRNMFEYNFPKSICHHTQPYNTSQLCVCVSVWVQLHFAAVKERNSLPFIFFWSIVRLEYTAHFYTYVDTLIWVVYVEKDLLFKYRHTNLQHFGYELDECFSRVLYNIMYYT